MSDRYMEKIRMSKLKVAVIGAGAAGMIAAYKAAEFADVTIYEKNEKPGKKIYITGKGRCNVTNASDMETILNHVTTNKKFMYSAFYTFTNEDMMSLLNEYGLELKVERGNRVFPVSDKSQDVIWTLRRMLRDRKVQVEYNAEIKDLMIDNGFVKGVILQSGRKEFYDKVIMATGGVSYPVTGSDGKGIHILEKAGHTVREMRPSLVPMNVGEEFVKELQGLSLKNISVSFYEEGRKKPIYEEFGEMMFTHFGVTGPVILSASSVIGGKIKNGNIRLVIDLKPALSEEQLDERILRDFKENMNKDFRNSLDKLLPKSMIHVIIEKSQIDPFKKVHEISREERVRLLNTIKGLAMTITSLRGFQEAIITSGGIHVKEINPATMESKIVKNLYIAGEMIDVDALTGGYNLQIAWSTGYLAGMAATESV